MPFIKLNNLYSENYINIPSRLYPTSSISDHFKVWKSLLEVDFSITAKFVTDSFNNLFNRHYILEILLSI